MAKYSYNEIGVATIWRSILRRASYLSLDTCLPAALSAIILYEGGSASSTQAVTRSDDTPFKRRLFHQSNSRAWL
jgi:hypothetical protein